MTESRKPEDCVSQADLKKQLHYNPDTGIFTRLIANSNFIKVGDVAGCMDKYGYIIININSKQYKAHRLAWFYVYGEWVEQIDHKKHIRDDNRINELRAALPSDNSKNKSKLKSNTSGVTGVYWSKPREKWIAQIWINKKPVNLGGFNDKFNAICARKSSENKNNYHENHGR